MPSHVTPTVLWTAAIVIAALGVLGLIGFSFQGKIQFT